jgi:molybdopterin synthase sulfur carrier subunit
VGDVLEVKVRFFTILREITGKREETLTFPNKALVSVNTILKVLSEKYGAQFTEYVYDSKTDKPRNFLQFLINGTSAATLNGTQTQLRNGDELAILPPVGGG